MGSSLVQGTGYDYTTPSKGCEYTGVRGPPLLTRSEAIEGGCVYTFLSIHNPLYKGRAPLCTSEEPPRGVVNTVIEPIFTQSEA